MSISVSSKIAKVGVAAVLGLGLTIGGGAAANAAAPVSNVGQFTVSYKGLNPAPTSNVGQLKPVNAANPATSPGAKAAAAAIAAKHAAAVAAKKASRG